MKNLYIGIMSGTSLDGIDIALCKISSKKIELIASHEYAFDKELKKEILYTIENKIRLKSIGLINTKLGYLYANAVKKFLRTYKIDSSQVEAIGLHGQTLWHEPNGAFPFSMQLGDANILSCESGIKVVSDFRSMDIANGGQGAPLTPAFHQKVFGHLGKKVAVVNIGGMSNITILGEQLKGWDTGPGNVLMDLWISKSKKQPFDKGGKFAGSGRVHKELLESFFYENYFHELPPKSTGREKFNKKYITTHTSEFENIKDRDIQRTLLELTAKTIIKDVKANEIKKLIVCGGGSKNRILMKRLKKLSKIEVSASDNYDVNSDFLEAMAFAWFAYKRMKREKLKISSVTGAKKDSLLGSIYG